MSPIMILLMTCALVTGMLAAGQPVAAGDPPGGGSESEPLIATEAPSTAPVWTNWGADQYALADDGEFIWIGATGGIVRWDKQQRLSQRYSAVDGLPHKAVLAVAVDATGNRWFGDDGGLSRLDPAEAWTHFSQTNSGLYSDLVDGIAVVGGDTLYVSHGLPSGSISRRDNDGTWRWFPDRETAIQADYAAIVQAHGSSPLWTVAGTEIWAGSRVFDGERWQERKLPGDGEPVSLAVDSRNHVWAASGASMSYEVTVYEWDGVGWLAHPVDCSCIDATITALAVDDGDTVWLGLQARELGPPYPDLTVVVRDLSGVQRRTFGVDGPVAALLPTAEGLWGIGPGWLMTSELTVTVLSDGPRLRNLTDALVGGDGALWLYSRGPDTMGAVQTLDDRGTLALQDDTWQVRPIDQVYGLAYNQVVGAFERAAADTWYAYCSPWKNLFCSNVVVRYHGEIRTLHALSWDQVVTDIFAQDQHHIWFAVQGWYVPYNVPPYSVLSLYDNGTPADTGDDVWRTYPIELVEGNVVVAVDANGQLWHGQDNGLYRYDGATWQLVYGEQPICDLAPAADGTLYAQMDCGGDGEILVVRPDGTIEDRLFSIEELIEH
jgi:hypothetical protein